MKWLEEYQIEKIVEEMRERHHERAAAGGETLEIDVGPGGVRVVVDGVDVGQPETIKLAGVARPIDNPTALLLVFNRRPSDDELRAIHERLR